MKIVARERGSRTVYFARWADPVKSRPETVIGPDGQPARHPSGRLRTRMRYVWVEKSLDSLGLKTVAARETWCKSKSKSLKAEAATIALGDAVPSETPVGKALADYYSGKKSELQPATLKAYLQGTRPFEVWCASQGVAFIESLTPAALARYREWFVGRPAHGPARGKPRAKSPAQENKCLNSLRVVLAQLRREGRLPAFDADAIVDSLQFVKRERARRRFLNTGKVRSLLEAAGRHDAGGHDAIAPFTAACLLTGMRFHELAELTWAEVDAEAGEITLAAGRTKTSTERTVRLDKLPTLWEWLKRGRLAAGGKGRVFPHLGLASARTARGRLIGGGEGHYGAPEFTWHRLRATCGTYSVCSSLYGSGSEHETAQQLGHSIQVAQAHYTGRARDCTPDAESLEVALGCPDLFASVFNNTRHPTANTA